MPIGFTGTFQKLKPTQHQEKDSEDAVQHAVENFQLGPVTFAIRHGYVNAREILQAVAAAM